MVMFSMKYFSLLFLVLFLVSCSSCSSKQNKVDPPIPVPTATQTVTSTEPPIIPDPEINWQPFDENSIDLADGGCLFAYFGKPNCAACGAIMETTFIDPEVVQIINERFVPVKIPNDPDLHDALGGPNEFPAILLVPGGDIYYPLLVEGYINSTDLIFVMTMPRFKYCGSD